jgi:starvation-inducible DNA-binding protein
MLIPAPKLDFVKRYAHFSKPVAWSLLMYISHLDLSEHIRKESIILLQARLSDALDLEAQMKQAHWNVKGRDFIQLHELFDEVHGLVEGFVDTIAERITTLGGVADGRVQTTAMKTELYEYSLATSTGEQHLKAVAAALGQFGKAIRKDVNAANGLGDAATCDLFTQISRENDKRLWFIEAHLM